MGNFDKKYILQSNLYSKDTNKEKNVNNVFWGEVVNINDETDGGRVKVRVPNLDNDTIDDNLPWCYPYQPKFFFVLPQVGEIVRIIIENSKYPNRGRLWVGPVISQLHKIDFDSVYTAFSTTNLALIAPDKAPSNVPESKGIFPEKKDIGLIGRKNTDILLKEDKLEIRVGKHERDKPLKLNKKNPSTITLNFDNINGNDISSNIIQADKICLIAHEGIPKFKFGQLNQIDRENIFNNAHPIPRGDLLIKALEIFRNAIIDHIHGYSNLNADNSKIIVDLKNIDLNVILQKNILIN